ncbi:uncharacterized protein [Physcomitrium patens]|uniref:uncharacterized protein isoform X4 n=1 Tax=Physcomitrium patens TaxID=3218 RepID=UPI003CCCE087
MFFSVYDQYLKDTRTRQDIHFRLHLRVFDFCCIRRASGGCKVDTLVEPATIYLNFWEVFLRREGLSSLKRTQGFCLEVHSKNQRRKRMREWCFWGYLEWVTSSELSRIVAPTRRKNRSFLKQFAQGMDLPSAPT